MPVYGEVNGMELKAGVSSLPTQGFDSWNCRVKVRLFPYLLFFSSVHAPYSLGCPIFFRVVVIPMAHAFVQMKVNSRYQLMAVVFNFPEALLWLLSLIIMLIHNMILFTMFFSFLFARNTVNWWQTFCELFIGNF
jgi:hypothetical protein